MKTTFLRFALLGLLAAGCSKKSDDPTPTPPAPDDVIALQLTGSGLSGLTPRLVISVAAGDDGKPAYVVPTLATDEYYSTAAVSKVVSVATVPHYRPGVKRYDFTATVSFTTAQAGSTGQLTAQWLVNGKPATATSRPPVVQINGAAAPTSGSAYLSTNSL